MSGVMNEEMLAERIERRAQEWDVAAPPFQAILGEGRRMRGRRRGWITGAVASVAVLAGAAGFAVAGLQTPSEVAPAHDPLTEGPQAQGQWVGINGVGIDVPAEWAAELVSCQGHQPFETWTMVSGAEAGDTCSPAPDALTFTFASIDEKTQRKLVGPPSEDTEERTVDGATYTVVPAQCSLGALEASLCLTGAYFPDQEVNIMISGVPAAGDVAAFLDTVRLVPGLDAPEVEADPRATGTTRVGVADASFAVPDTWEARGATCGPAPVGSDVDLDEVSGGRPGCTWTWDAGSSSLMLVDLAGTPAQRAKFAATFNGLQERTVVDGRTVGTGPVTCSDPDIVAGTDEACAGTMYLPEPGLMVNVQSWESAEAVQEVMDSLEFTPAG